MQEQKKSLVPSLTLVDGISLVAGSMIGSAIFIVPAAMTRDLGGMGFFILGFLVAGFLAIIGALHYSELATLMPHAGGQYVYIKEIYGKKTAFVYGWTLFGVIQSGAIAAVAVAFGKYLNEILFSLNIHILPDVVDLKIIQIPSDNIIAIIMVAMLTFINMKSVQYGATVQRLFTISKFLALIGIVVVSFIFKDKYTSWEFNVAHFWDTTHVTKDANGNLITTTLTSWVAITSAFLGGLIGAIFGSDYWNSLSFVSSEVKNPVKTIPRAFIIGIILVIGVYLLVIISYCLVLPTIGNANATQTIDLGMQFAQKDRVGSAVLNVLFGQQGSFIMALLILISLFGCNNGLILSGSRVYYVMAKDNLFFTPLKTLNTNNIPQTALKYQFVWVCVLCVTGQYNALLDYLTLAVMIFYIITISGIFIHRIKYPTIERPIKSWGYPYSTIVYLIIAFLICVNLIWIKPQNTIPCLIIVLLGIPIYYIFKKTLKA